MAWRLVVKCNILIVEALGPTALVLDKQLGSICGAYAETNLNNAFSKTDYEREKSSRDM